MTILKYNTFEKLPVIVCNIKKIYNNFKTFKDTVV